MAIDWERIDQERRIDEAKEAAFQEGERARRMAKAAREEMMEATSDIESRCSDLDERVAALEAQVERLLKLLPPAAEEAKVSQ